MADNEARRQADVPALARRVASRRDIPADRKERRQGVPADREERRQGVPADRAYVTGLRLLARRELSEAQLRTRLERRLFDAAEIDTAVAQLRRERALDDRRTALACARTEALVKHRGRARVLRRVEGLGIARATARAAVAEVFADVDERAMIAAALDRRLRAGLSLRDAAVARRVHRYLLAQGFDPSSVLETLRQRGAVFYEP